MTSKERKAADALEWKRFLEFAEAEAKSGPARARVQELLDPEHWAEDVSTANQRQHETQEASALLSRDALWGPLNELSDPETVLERLEKGSVLEVTELAFIRRWLYAIDAWTQVPRDEIRGELFKKALSTLPDPYEPLRILDRVLTPEGDLSERASPKLAGLYQEIRSLKREIGSILDHLLKTFSQKGILQETFSDVRDGRYVIPVKISSQGEVDGIIYEASASRQTVFVEPKEISPLNNRLRQRQNDLLQEIYAVLTETSKRLQPFTAEIQQAVLVLAYWDSVQARARIALHYAGKPIHVSEERAFFLHETAHPLLWRSLATDQIIRNDIDFGNSSRAFLITGPNTGGKTVLMKTLGLAGLCARTGFPFPGTGQLTVPFFDHFFADLGDPQSLEEHLSSFSGHILKFKEILEGLTDRSLVLIDELNTATDPEEGAALSRAFLETLMSSGSMVIATTHDPHLKAYAVSDSRIINASMEFDEESRAPTFRIVTGVPGRSRALETAERLGMPLPVLELARSYLSKEHLAFEELLGQMQSDAREAARARKEAVALREKAEQMKMEWTQRTERSVSEMMDRTRHKLRRILEQAQDEVRSTVKKLDEMTNRRELDRSRSKLNETFTFAATRLDTALAEEAPDIAEALANKAASVEAPETAAPILGPGTQVRIPKWKSTGTVLEIAGNKAKVSMGSIQMTLAISDVEPLLKSELAQLEAVKQPARKKSPESERPAPPPSQLDIRGIRLDEAMRAVERYLDVAYRSGALVEVTIVHGLGTGALREGTRKILKELPYVKTYRDGGVGAGGAGATIIEFERD